MFLLENARTMRVRKDYVHYIQGSRVEPILDNAFLFRDKDMILSLSAIWQHASYSRSATQSINVVSNVLEHGASEGIISVYMIPHSLGIDAILCPVA